MEKFLAFNWSTIETKGIENMTKEKKKNGNSNHTSSPNIFLPLFSYFLKNGITRIFKRTKKQH
jgi:hypothetical protein